MSRKEKSLRRSKRVCVCVFCVSGFANLVHRHNHQRTSPRIHDQLAHRRELGGDRHARVLQRVHSHGLARYRWVIRPYLVHEVAGGGREAVQGENTNQNKKTGANELKFYGRNRDNRSKTRGRGLRFIFKVCVNALGVCYAGASLHCVCTHGNTRDRACPRTIQ